MSGLSPATNRNLEEAMKSGSFRHDLYYRLNVVLLTMPPLRDRPEDISLLVNYFIAENTARSADARISGIAPKARHRLMRYTWPGNVRELENAIERAVVLGSSDLIVPEDLPETVLEAEVSVGFPLPEIMTQSDRRRKRSSSRRSNKPAETTRKPRNC